MKIRKALSTIAIFSLFCTNFLFLSKTSVRAAAFTEFGIRPSRIEVSVTGVNFLIKASPVTTATEDGVQVNFDTGYTLTSGAGAITISTTSLTSWDSECTNAWPSIAAGTATGQTVDFTGGDLTVGQTYCFIITAGVQNPSSIGNYSISVDTRAASADVDTGAFTFGIVDDDEIVINADVAAFVRCDVTTTTGSDNTIDLGVLEYGTVTSSSDDIQIQGGTNASEGMAWFYRSDTANNGLYSVTASALLDGATAEDTISATTADCTAADPCFGIYYNGTTGGTGTFAANTSFTGGSVTAGVGPMTTSTYGNEIGTSSGTVCSALTANFNVNATAGENSPIATDYTDTLIFTCKADI
ncbi:MAG: hypothetical protein PHS44_04795 [Candidatus Dojkabacteria bacterium]|jgi:hypothetical protein|nr:hypothetical protein [Candidatus Dojkabacteria bacterium]